MGGALDRRDFNCLRRSYCVDAFRVICVAVNFDAMLCADLVGVFRSAFRFFICFFLAPTRFSEVLDRFRSECECTTYVNYFTQNVRSFNFLRCTSDFENEERIYAFTSDCSAVNGRLFNFVAIRFILDNEKWYSVAFLAPEADAYCVFTTVFFYVFASASAMWVFRFRSRVRFFAICSVQVVSMAV